MTRLAKSIDSINDLIKYAELITFHLKTAKDCAIRYESGHATKYNQAAFVKRYEMSINESLELLIATLRMIPLCAVSDEHLQKLCKKCDEFRFYRIRKAVIIKKRGDIYAKNK